MNLRGLLVHHLLPAGAPAGSRLIERLPVGLRPKICLPAPAIDGEGQSRDRLWARIDQHGPRKPGGHPVADGTGSHGKTQWKRSRRPGNLSVENVIGWLPRPRDRRDRR